MDVIWVFSTLMGKYGRPEHKAPLDPVDELVLTILSQNTNDTNRDRAYRSLRERFPVLDMASDADPAEIEDAIRVGGLARSKGANIKTILSDLRKKHGRVTLDHLKDMDPEEAFSELVSMKGVGTKTAACVMIFSLGQPFFPVDTHIHRICIRLGLVGPGTDRERTQTFMDAIVPDEWKYDGHLLMIEHGRRLCRARGPDCPHCPLQERCPRVGVTVVV
jgi:endonuclease III